MDGELLSESSNSMNRGGGSLDLSTPKSYTEMFEEVLPYYLVCGMTMEQFWDGDPDMARFFRRADKLRQRRMNEQLWLQGMYVYEAIGCMAPVLQAFAKKGTKPGQYPSEPYALDDETKTEREAVRQKEAPRKGMEYMQAFMEQHNARFKKKTTSVGGVTEGMEVKSDGNEH